MALNNKPGKNQFPQSQRLSRKYIISESNRQRRKIREEGTEGFHQQICSGIHAKEQNSFQNPLSMQHRYHRHEIIVMRSNFSNNFYHPSMILPLDEKSLDSATKKKSTTSRSVC